MPPESMLVNEDSCFQITVESFVNTYSALSFDSYLNAFRDDEGNIYKPIIAWERQTKNGNFDDLTPIETKNLFHEIYYESDIERFVVEDVD